LPAALRAANRPQGDCQTRVAVLMEFLFSKTGGGIMRQHNPAALRLLNSEAI
jgi:hypothetical protein